jgi:polyketide biosynthesis acyl carrier protein
MNADEIFAVICDNVRQVLSGIDDRPLARTDRLDALGANSVDRMEIVIMTLERLDLNIPVVATHGPRNIGELAELLSTKF